MYIRCTKEQLELLFEISRVVGKPYHSSLESARKSYDAGYILWSVEKGGQSTLSCSASVLSVVFEEGVVRLAKMLPGNPVIVDVGEYNAEVDPEKRVVKVGCQTITFAKIAEVYEATRQQAYLKPGDRVCFGVEYSIDNGGTWKPVDRRAEFILTLHHSFLYRRA